MKRIFLTLVFLLTTLMCVDAQSLLSFETGYQLSLTEEGVPTMTADRKGRVYVHGNLFNVSGLSQSIRLGVEMVDVKTGEKFYDEVTRIKDWGTMGGLSYFTFYPSFVLLNGDYHVYPVYMTYSQDATDTANWKRIAVPVGFEAPVLTVTGDEPLAYMIGMPYVGNKNNIAEIGDTRMHLTLKTLTDIQKGELYVFVFAEESERSIGYYYMTVDQKAGETKDYVVEYKKDGRNPDDLNVGHTYSVSFRLFVDKKEQDIFDYIYRDYTFRVVEDGAGIEELESDAAAETGRKMMLPDGRVVVEKDGGLYQVMGNIIK